MTGRPAQIDRTREHWKAWQERACRGCGNIFQPEARAAQYCDQCASGGRGWAGRKDRRNGRPHSEAPLAVRVYEEVRLDNGNCYVPHLVSKLGAGEKNSPVTREQVMLAIVELQAEGLIRATGLALDGIRRQGALERVAERLDSGDGGEERRAA
jgi:hypothetical protein